MLVMILSNTLSLVQFRYMHMTVVIFVRDLQISQAKAVITHEKLEVSNITDSSLLYLAPETFLHGVATQSSDVYSAAMIVFHLLSGMCFKRSYR